MRLGVLVVGFSLWFVSISLALPPGERGRGFREGANHHLGDDSFIARHGRAPAIADGEPARMHVHLTYIRDVLAARAATRPDLAARRAQLLGYLDEYIAAGITPKNTYVPWRSPVFIDAAGNICAVGYLIERTVGREVAERIARAHRLEFLEDIAVARPEVRAWVAASGLTLEELASIQPGYEGPDVQYLDGFITGAITDGPVKLDANGIVTTGAFAKQRMTGTWTSLDRNQQVVGTGEFKAGAGMWRSKSPGGGKLAEGPFVDNRAHGGWKVFHPSGRLAAEGTFHRGLRHGAWRFYHDTAAPLPIAAGSFTSGRITGAWRHYDASGKLLATATTAPRRSTRDYYNDGLFLSITPGRDGVRHETHGGIPAAEYRMDAFYLGDERLYVREDGTTYDAHGNRLTQVDGTWHARDCKWSTKRKQAANAGDLVTVHVMLLNKDSEADSCAVAKPVAPARGKRITATLAAMSTVRAPTPAFVKAYLTTDAPDGEAASDEPADLARNTNDLAVVIASHMTWYMEWPHIDGMFRAVFATLPGYNRDRE